jgi:hypothetical protein
MAIPFKYKAPDLEVPTFKTGALSAIDATDPYAVQQRMALEADASRWKAKEEALRAARLDAPDKMERITQALLAFSAPTRGNNWAALGNAAKSLSATRMDAADIEREQANKLTQLRAQQEDAASAIKEKYGFAGAQAQQAMALKRLEGTEILMSGPRNDIPIYKTGPRAGQTATGYTAPPAGVSGNKPTSISGGGRTIEGWTDDRDVFHPFPKEPKEPPTAAEVAQAAEDLAKSKEVGHAAGVAQAALASAKTNVNSTIALINNLENHKGLSAVIGLPNPMKGGYGFAQALGSDAADFKTQLDNLTGKMFIAAFESLKGGGAISEKEGEAATRAIANLSKLQSEKQFKQNLATLKQTLANGYATLEQKAKGSAGIKPSGTPVSPETKTINGVTYEKRGNDWYTQ